MSDDAGRRLVAQRLRKAMTGAQFIEQRSRLTGRRISATEVTLAGAPAGKVWVRTDDQSRDADAVWGDCGLINISVIVAPNAAGEYEIVKKDSTKTGAANQRAASASLLPSIDDKVVRMSITGKSFVPGRLIASASGGLYVQVEAFRHSGGWFPGGDLLLVAPGTAGKIAWVGVSLNPGANTLAQTLGTLRDVGSVMDEATLETDVTCPTGHYPLGAVVLENGQTALDVGGIWADWRLHLDAGGTSGGGIATVQEEGTALTARSILNFVGVNVAAVDDAPNTRTNVTLSDYWKQSNTIGAAVALTLASGQSSVWAGVLTIDGTLTIDGYAGVMG